MDRRFALAIVLSFLVLMAFQMWFAPKKPEPVSEPVATETGSAPSMSQTPDSPVPTPLPAAGETTAGEPEEVATSPALLSPAVEEEVETAGSTLFHTTLTNRGGRIESWTLNNYDTPEGTPVSMVRESPELGLVLDTERGPRSLDATLYATRTESIEGGKRITFEAGDPSGLQVTKTYTIPEDGYDVRLQVSIRGAGDAPSYRIVWSGGLPISEGDHKQFRSHAGAVVLVGKSVTGKKPSDFKKEPRRIEEGNVRWGGVRSKYFLSVIVPPAETSSRVVMTGDPDQGTTGVELVMPILSGRAEHDFLVYMGPMEYDRLKRLGSDLEKGVDLGYNFIRPISQLLLTVMVWMYDFLPNYGLIIIIISALTKILFYPLTKSSFRSMKSMSQLQPHITEIRDKYKSDPQRMNKEIMDLYKEHKVNPVGGCLPILLQMPVFFALYSVLANTITMRQADFVWWINDLSIPDTIATIGTFPIHLLPVVMFVTTILQQKVTPVTDPRQKMMGYMMPVVMLFIFYSFPAGLNLYWTVNNILTVAQQWSIHREAPAIPPAPAKA